MRRKKTTPTSPWVAYKALSILKKTPNMGVKEFQSKLQDDLSVLLFMTPLGREKKRL